MPYCRAGTWGGIGYNLGMPFALTKAAAAALH